MTSGVEIGAIITALCVGIGGLIVSWVNARGTARKNELDSLRLVIDTLQADITNQASRISGLKTENDNMHIEQNSLRAENMQLRQELENVREENIDQRKDVGRIRQENERLNARVKAQNGEINRLQQENAALRKQLAAFTASGSSSASSPASATPC